MKRKTAAAIVFNWVVCGGAAFSQQTTVPTKDDGVSAASLLVGKALFLRGFYLNNGLPGCKDVDLSDNYLVL
jgi:hypothetical protein